MKNQTRCSLLALLTVFLSSLLVLVACQFNSINNSQPEISASLICKNASKYKGQVVGDGHCVSLIKLCSSAPNTPAWRPGIKVLGNNIPYGSIIATFEKGRYPNRTGYHAAIYISQDKRGIWVWDQWVGKPVHKRLIRRRDDGAAASNSAEAYSVVRLN